VKIGTWTIIVFLVAAIIAVYAYQYYVSASSSTEPMPDKGIYIVRNGKLESINITKIPPSNGTVLIALLSSTCPHCHAFWPTLYKVARELENKISVYFVILDPALSEPMRDIALYFYNNNLWDGSVPAIIVYRNGSYVATWIGRMDETELLNKINEVIS